VHGKTDITIRKAAPEDTALVLQFIRDIAAYEKLSSEVVATAETIRESLFGAEPAAEVAIAEVDGMPVGFVIYFENFSTFVGRPGLYIEDLFVRPEHRGAGVGKALLKHCAAIARERGLGRMEWAVLDWNPARAFYESFGAKPMSDWIVYRLAGDALKRLADS
jgi:GNAT superfamily N-acetyltransferase